MHWVIFDYFIIDAGLLFIDRTTQFCFKYSNIVTEINYIVASVLHLGLPLFEKPSDTYPSFRFWMDCLNYQRSII